MTGDHLPADGESNILNQIRHSCENLINQTQTDLELFRHEQNQLREQILSILKENQTLNTKLEVLKSSATSTVGESRDDATREQLTRDALKNVQMQIEYLQAENKELRQVSKASRKTIQNLQDEIQNYRKQLYQPNSVDEVKQKFSKAIKMLEFTIRNQNSELEKQGQIIEKLFQQKKDLHETLRQTQEALKVKTQEEANHISNNTLVLRLQQELLEATNQNKELEKSLKMSRRMIDERFQREKDALQKVQEAIAIAEAAVIDKENAQKREQVVKEECDNLASTIGAIMKEAARKVDLDIETLKKGFLDKEKSWIEKNDKLNEDLLNHKKFNEIFEARCNRIEQKYKDVLVENERLSRELQNAQQNIGRLELKLANSEHLLEADKQAQLMAKEREKEIQHYVEIYKQSKENYKNAIVDVTQKFEKEIYRLQNENATLKAENRDLRANGAESKTSNPLKE